MDEISTPSRPFLKPVLAWLALLPLLIVVFYPAMSGSFLLDDSSGIQNNSDIRHVTVDNLMRLFRGHGNVRAVDHHPVSALSFMIDYQLAGLDPGFYHVNNLIHHWIAAGAMMWLFLTIWGIWQKQRGRDPLEESGFWMAAGLMFVWAVHPFATMPVGYIMCRQETLLVLFYVLSMTCLLRDWERASYFLAVPSFLCKEVAVTLPGALFLVDWAQGGVGVVETFRKRWQYYGVLTSTWLLICLYHLRGGRRNEIFAEGMPLAATSDYFKVQCGVILTYFSKLFWPVKLMFYPYIRPVENWSEWVPGLIFLLVYIAVAVYSLRWSRWLAVVLIFPLLVLSPTSSVLPIPFEPSMEYRMYLPSVAIIGLLMIGLWRWVPKFWMRAGIVAALVIPLAVVSHLRSRDYETPMKLYEHDYAVNPKSLNTLEGLAGIYLEAKRYDIAAERAWKMIDWAMADNNKDFVGRGFNFLGDIESQKKNPEAAKDFYRRGIAINGNWGSKLNLAVAHLDLKEYPEAEKLLIEYLRYAPDSQNALLMLYETKLGEMKLEEAEKILNEFTKTYPDRTDLDSQHTRLMILKRRRAEEQNSKP
ncbi:MAG: hypothetical protein NTW74_11045 [Acidobacteria bacterium]|nr:hypothetical protein [Acidobacteriota bacterium]